MDVAAFFIAHAGDPLRKIKLRLLLTRPTE